MSYFFFISNIRKKACYFTAVHHWRQCCSMNIEQHIGHLPTASYTPGHVVDALGSIVLIVGVVGDVFQVVHVCPDQHGPQLHKVTV